MNRLKRGLVFFVVLPVLAWSGQHSLLLAQQPPPNGEGPYFHQVYSATSSDGFNWTHDNRMLLDHASVPAAILTPEGAIRIYYVDATTPPENVNCAESSDGGVTFKVLGCAISQRSGEKAVDPSIVRLSDGRYRLYYFGVTGHPDAPGTHTIYSAISDDGVHFTQEKAVFAYSGLVDPDVFWNGKEWLMYVFSHSDRATIIAKSQDGLSFDYVGPLSPRDWGTTAPIKLDDGRFRLYAFSQRGQKIVGSFLSTDGYSWTQEPGIRLTAPEGKEITDPFVVRLPNGTWKMFFKLSPDKRVSAIDAHLSNSSITEKYLLSFHACDTTRANCNDPRNHRVYLAQGNDGANWNIVPNWTPYQGSVPDVIRRGDILYIYTPGQAKRYRFTANTWEDPVPVKLTANDKPIDDGYVDPSLILDEQGRLVLFYLAGVRGQDPAQCARGETTCTKFIRSATEVSGSDGTLFSVNAGDRVAVTLRPNPFDSASDPDIFFDGQKYLLYLSRGPSTQVFTSTTLHGSYSLIESLPEGYLARNSGGVPAGFFDTATQQYWTYVTSNGKIRRAVHATFSKSLNEADWTTTLTASSFGFGPTINVESPGIAANVPKAQLHLNKQTSVNCTQSASSDLPLLKQARTAAGQRYQYAIEKGAQILATPDGKSFALLWYPPQTNQSAKPPMIVTLHGHGVWAFDEFFIWHPYALARGYGILALQWWFGGGESTSDYYSPTELYPIIACTLQAQGIPTGKNLLHGFSRGSAVIYAMSVLDHFNDKFFKLTIANAGGAAKDYPPNIDIDQGKFGAAPFSGTHWLFFCGGRDPNPGSTCPVMRDSRNWVTQLGGSSELFIEDPNADHGGFHRTPAHVNAALDVFAQLLKK